MPLLVRNRVVQRAHSSLIRMSGLFHCMLRGEETMADKYIPQEIEPKWQARWEQDELYKAAPAGDKPKYYILDFYPYQSIRRLHGV